MTLGIKGMAHIEPHGGMIPWLILSHVGDDVIKKNLEIKEKGRKMGSHLFDLRKEGRKLPPFVSYD